MAAATPAELARRLARDAEAVCRHYLSNGRREGRYWLVGDVRNTPGRSLFVRLKGPESGKGAAGKWTDAATGEHGDLLDVIRESRGLADFRDVADEARRFLSLPRPEPEPTIATQRSAPAPAGSPEAARRLFAMSQPIAGTLAETYLRRSRHYGFARNRKPALSSALLLSPGRPWSPTETWPAMIAAVTDLDGKITGAHRTWLDPSGDDKAPIDTPRRAMGDLLGHAVRFGVADDVMAAGEGIETMLSLRCVLPDHADGGGALGRASRRHPVPGTRCAGSTSPATTIRRATARWRRLIDRAQRGRDRGDPAVAAARRLQRRSSARSASTRFGRPSGFSSRRRTSRASWSWRHEPERDDGIGGGAGLASCRIAALPAIVGEDRAHGLLRGRSVRQTARPGNGGGRLFSVGGRARLCIAKQNSRPPPSSASLRPSASLRVQVRSARRLSSPRRPRWARPIRRRKAP